MNIAVSKIAETDEYVDFEIVTKRGTEINRVSKIELRATIEEAIENSRKVIDYLNEQRKISQEYLREPLCQAGI